MARSSISPPPSKRRRFPPPTISTTQSDTAIPPPAHAPLAPTLPSRPIPPFLPPHLRIFSWNINGIAPFLQPTISSFFPRAALPRSPRSRDSSPPPAPSLRACLQRWQWPQLVCLQEVKSARRDTATQHAVRHAVQAPRGVPPGEERQWDYTAHFGLPRDRFNARAAGGRVYGVCTLVREDLLAGEEIVKEVAWDLEGRVLVTEVRSRRVAVFNVYAVNGTGNAWRDARTGAVLGTRHECKRAFHAELQRECEGYEARGWVVVVAGIMNVARSALDGFPGRRMEKEHVQSRRDFEEKFMGGGEEGGLGMVDTYRALRVEERKYSYRGRGCEWGRSCDRVDLILLSGGGVTKGRVVLVGADILDEEKERGPSDHLPLYVTIAVDPIQDDQECTWKRCKLCGIPSSREKGWRGV
ncbi:hypothetical protein MMC13_004162 [Lambiella insularis]|nr:hypothetical protein [Lambiella insularis]